jgi:carboxypeptidase Q
VQQREASWELIFGHFHAGFRLTQGAAVTTVTVYAIADSKEPFAAHLSATEVQSMLQKAGKLEDYNYEKATGTLP